MPLISVVITLVSVDWNSPFKDAGGTLEDGDVGMLVLSLLDGDEGGCDGELIIEDDDVFDEDCCEGVEEELPDVCEEDEIEVGGGVADEGGVEGGGDDGDDGDNGDDGEVGEDESDLYMY